MGQESFKLEGENEAFWQQLQDSLSSAMDLLVEMALEYGTDPELLEAAGSTSQEAEIRDHLLIRAASEYLKLVGEWFDAPNENCGKNTGDVISGYNEQVILRYHTLIWAKLNRAILALYEAEAFCPNALSSDADGSAKVALIAMDRSIAAWWRLRGKIPGQKKTILKCMVLLARLREATELTFVNARSFIRPGFDEVDLQQ